MIPDRRFRFFPHLQSLVRFFLNSKTDWKPKTLVAIAVLYLLWPLDLIPDIAPLIGWLDDVGLVTFAFAYLAHAARE